MVQHEWCGCVAVAIEDVDGRTSAETVSGKSVTIKQKNMIVLREHHSILTLSVVQESVLSKK